MTGRRKEKLCPVCSERKPIEAFLGKGYCPPCHNEYSRRRYHVRKARKEGVELSASNDTKALLESALLTKDGRRSKYRAKDGYINLAPMPQDISEALSPYYKEIHTLVEEKKYVCSMSHLVSKTRLMVHDIHLILLGELKEVPPYSNSIANRLARGDFYARVDHRTLPRPPIPDVLPEHRKMYEDVYAFLDTATEPVYMKTLIRRLSTSYHTIKSIFNGSFGITRRIGNNLKSRLPKTKKEEIIMPTAVTMPAESEWGTFGSFRYYGKQAVCECGERFELKPLHMKFKRPCWHLDKKAKQLQDERLNRRMGAD